MDICNVINTSYAKVCPGLRGKSDTLTFLKVKSKVYILDWQGVSPSWFMANFKWSQIVSLTRQILRLLKTSTTTLRHTEES